MKTEKEKMLAGELYDPLDPQLCAERERARDLCQDLNATREKAYVVQQSKLRFFRQAFAILWLTARLCFGYGALLAKYRKGYAEITVPGFWHKVLKLTKPPADSAKADAAKT